MRKTAKREQRDHHGPTGQTSNLPKTMRVIALFLTVVLSALSAGAADVYVSPTGNDTTGNGSLAHPYQRIQKAADMATAGSNVYIRAGTYRETVTITNSGTPTSPIVFQPYKNESVTITGLDQVNSGWTNDGGGYYSRTTPLVASNPDLFLGGLPAQVARWPNPVYKNPLRASFNQVNTLSVANPADSSITPYSPVSRGADYWMGATMSVIAGNQTTLGRSANVTSSTDDTVHFQWPDNSFPLTRNDPFCLTNVKNAVTTGNQWYYDSATNKLNVYSPGADPSNGGFEFRSRRDGFVFGSGTDWQKAAQYVTVKDIRFNAANIQFAAYGSNSTVDHCRVLYPDAYAAPNGYGSVGTGICMGGSSNTVKNSEIAYAWGSGVLLAGSSHVVTNNVVHDTNVSGGYAAAITSNGGIANSAITNNTVYNTGFSGMLVGGMSNATISNNDISRFGALNKDLGGIHTDQTNAGGTEIAYNRIHDSRYGASAWNAGVMLDSGASNYTVHHNLIYNTRTGVELNGAGPEYGGPNENVDVYNNTMWGVSYAMSPNGNYSNVKVWNNLSNATSTSGGVYWTGTTTSNNLRTTTDQFRDSARGDYRLNGEWVQAEDYGTQLGGKPDTHYHTAPDAGAFELNDMDPNAPMWTAGASFKGWLAGDQRVATLSSALWVNHNGTRSNASSLNVGKSTSFGNSYNRRSFMKFDLTDINAVNSAVLRLYESQPNSGANGVTLYQVTSSWDESTTDLYNRSVGESVAGWYDQTNLDLYTEIDITRWVQDWLSNPSSNYGLSLRSTDESSSGTGKWWDGYYGITAPQLIITLPEPGSIWLLISALLAGSGALAWRKRR
jgi:hypothetical protein